MQCSADDLSSCAAKKEKKLGLSSYKEVKQVNSMHPLYIYTAYINIVSRDKKETVEIISISCIASGNSWLAAEEFDYMPTPHAT